MLVQFSQEPHSSETQCHLLELSDPILQAAVKDKELLLIKGFQEEEVVLCAKDTSFRVRQVHTSNLLVLITANGKVSQMHTSYLEATCTPGRVKVLHDWLEACVYNGPDEVSSSSLLQKLHHSRIFCDIQASENEIRAALHSSGAIFINGHYRKMGSDYLCRFFRALFAALDMNDLAYFDEIPTEKIVLLLSADGEFPIEVARHILKSYSHQQEESPSCWSRLECQKICRFFANELFKDRKTWGEQEFLKEWNRVIGGLCPRLEMLRGLALIDKSSPGDAEASMTFFPASSLPLDPIERFQVLFQTKSRWELGAIEVYVEDAAKVKSLETIDLIVKHARITLDPKTLTKTVTALLPL